MPAHASKSCLCVRSSVKESLRLERYHPYFLPELRDSRHVQLPFAEYTHNVQTEVITVLSAAQSLRLAREMAFKAALKIQNDVENSVQHNEHVVDLMLALRLCARRQQELERRRSLRRT